MNVDPLKQVNERLEGLDDTLFPNPGVSDNVFIVGAPRSGTTLTSQVLAYAFDIGYINNVAATFWEAPAAGVCYAKRFVRDKTFVGRSHFGQTSDPSEPHEFGGFWRSRLNYNGMIQKIDHDIDWPQLIRALDQIGEACQSPVVYKVFQLAWHLAEFDSLRPNSKWIWVKRDLSANVQSLLNLSQHRNDRWTSAVPYSAIQQFDECEDWQRVTAQVVLIHDWLEQQFSNVASHRVFRLDLEDLIQHPSSAMKSLEQFLDVKADPKRVNIVANGMKPQTPLINEFSRLVNQFAIGVGT